MNRAPFLAVLAILVAAALVPSLSAAASSGSVHIIHTPPSSAAPGRQIEIDAVLVNATSAIVLWNNGSLAKPATVPMTNLSRAQGGGWDYEAWLPAQPDGAQVTYSITATGPAGSSAQTYTLAVAAPSSQGFTPADQSAWVWTLAASVSMAASAVVAIFYYTSLRLRREPR
ncbi:MAG TPA: hypothetical protein VEY12_12360 [Thermoplasmata archaeon]|nr:hypothetical protein [Thermoplasmata archaeon]